MLTHWLLPIVPFILWGTGIEKSKLPTPPIGTTTFPPVGGRRVVPCRCRIDLGTGMIQVTQPKDLEDDESAVWKSPAKEIVKNGRRYRVTLEDRTSERDRASSGLSDWVRVSVVESDERTGAILRKLPIQDLRGKHERHDGRALVLKDGVLRFWIQFWTDD